MTEMTTGGAVWLHIRGAEGAFEAPLRAAITKVSEGTVSVAWGDGGGVHHRDSVLLCEPEETVAEDVDCYCTVAADAAEPTPACDDDPATDDCPDPLEAPSGPESEAGQETSGHPDPTETETELLG